MGCFVDLVRFEQIVDRSHKLVCQLCWVGGVSDFCEMDACQLSQALFYVVVFVHQDNS